MKTAVSFATALVASGLGAATVDQVIVRQQWPWSTDVKVEYRLSGVDAAHPVDISVAAFNGSTPLDSSRLASAMTGDLYGVTEEFGEFHIDPVAAFGAERVALTKFKVQLTVSDSPAGMTDAIYKIIRISDGDCTDVSRADLLNGKYGTYETDYSSFYSAYTASIPDGIIWTGVTNNPAYKTTHIVMRRIKCKNIQWTMGDPDTLLNYSDRAPQCQVVLTNDFWIGVFPVTIGQWKEADPDSKGRTTVFVYPENTNECAATTTYLRHLRAGSTTVTHNFPQMRHSVSSDSLCGKLRAKTGYDFEVPTEAQWEFAARGGVYSLHLFTGEVTDTAAKLEAAVKRVAWIDSNSKISGTTYWHPVGTKNPNPYGLYDIIGTIAEVMLNKYYDYDVDHVTYEPEGGESGTSVWRSMTMANSYTFDRIGNRLLEDSSQAGGHLSSNGTRGGRLILPDTEGLVYPDFEKP